MMAIFRKKNKIQAVITFVENFYILLCRIKRKTKEQNNIEFPISIYKKLNFFGFLGQLCQNDFMFKA
jgi:hypothetical protein